MDLTLNKEEVIDKIKQAIIMDRVICVCEMETGEFEFKYGKSENVISVVGRLENRDTVEEVWLHLYVNPIQFGCFSGEEFVEKEEFDTLIEDIISKFAGEGVEIV